ncbi:MAG: SDR family oxidoreductase [Chloroflexi bacterium]|nr:SDR family oxidoreductase [Chloroflexota bacterium]
MFDLKGHTALVTGAGQNIGAGIAKALAAQNAAVIVNDYHLERAESVARDLLESGARALAVQGDVTDLESVRRMVNEAQTSVGPIDILVNNAGNAGAGAFVPIRFRDMPIEGWDQFLKVNLYGVLNCVKAVLDPMCERHWGRIITISSEGYRTGTSMGISLYAAGKAGAVGFSKQLSSEVGRFGVTVNCLVLGTMNTFPQAAQQTRSYPIPRPGTPEDIGAAAVFLASEEASWITGQAISVNGGVVTA